MSLPSRQAFEAVIGATFRVSAVAGLGGPSEIVLRSMEERRAATGWECFSMIYEGPAVTALPQGSFPVSHERLGELELFLVPIGESAGVRVYEAIVYRPLPSGSGSR